jgi:diaminohydroxyphosphoribosylaminopyrimidine deaminase/5-amino-6-(5-phosphoribosylamino)uracil reductase
VITDDPFLTTRLPDRAEVRHPLRVVLDSAGRVPLGAHLFDPAAPGRTLVATTAAMPAAQREALQARGVEVLTLPTGEDGRVDLPALLDELGRMQVVSLLVEGGGTVLEAFFRGRLVDKLLAFFAPIVIGGREAPTAVAGTGIARLAEAPRLQRVRVEAVGEDLLVSGYPHWDDGADG